MNGCSHPCRLPSCCVPLCQCKRAVSEFCCSPTDKRKMSLAPAREDWKIFFLTLHSVDNSEVEVDVIEIEGFTALLLMFLFRCTV